MTTTRGYAAQSKTSPVGPLEFERRKPGASDVQTEMTPISKINEAYERMLKNDVKYRFVIDMASLGE